MGEGTKVRGDFLRNLISQRFNLIMEHYDLVADEFRGKLPSVSSRIRKPIMGYRVGYAGPVPFRRRDRVGKYT